MKFWIYFDETENGVVSVTAVTLDKITHLHYAADAVWLLEDGLISWHKDRLTRMNEPMSVDQYHMAVTKFWNELCYHMIKT